MCLPGSPIFDWVLLESFSPQVPAMGVGHRICLHSLQHTPNYTVYAETYFRKLSKTQPKCSERLLTPLPCGLPVASLPTTLPHAGSPGYRHPGPLDSLTSCPFLSRPVHSSPTFFHLVSSHPLVHSYLLSSCQSIRRHARCWSHSTKQSKAHMLTCFTVQAERQTVNIHTE